MIYGKKNLIVRLIDNVVKICYKPLDYLYLLLMIISAMGMIFLSQLNLFLLSFLYMGAISYVILVIFGQIASLNIFVRMVSEKKQKLGNILSYFFIVLFNLIIVGLYYIPLVLISYKQFEAAVRLHDVPILILAWLVTSLPLRFLSSRLKKENKNLTTLYLVFALLSLIIIPSIILSSTSRIISLVVLTGFVAVIIPIYYYKSESEQLFDANSFLEAS